MLRQIWVLLSAGTVVGGLAAGNAAVVALGLLVAGACAAAMLWARWSLRRLDYERIVPEDHAFPGERVGMQIRITNRKPLPLPWLDVRERFPEPMVPERGEEFAQSAQVSVVHADWRTYVGPHQRVSRGYGLYCPDRGVYEIGPARLRSGDVFGLFSEEREEERRARIVVYPRTVTIEELGLPVRRPYGERPTGIRVFEDPTRVAGVRDYRPGDTLRRIDWNATARLGKLQARVFDPSSAHHLLLCLNVQTTVPVWSGFVPELLERGISVAASLARDAYDRRYSVGLLANSTYPDADRAIRIAPGQRPEQFIRMLESLAVVTPFVLEPLAAMLDKEEHRLALGTTVAVISGVMPDELASTLLRLAARGHAVVVLSTSGDAWAETIGEAVRVIDVSHIDLPWRKDAEGWAPGTHR